MLSAQEYSVFGLAAHSMWELLLRQVQEFHPHCIAVVDDAAADRAARELTACRARRSFCEQRRS